MDILSDHFYSRFRYIWTCHMVLLAAPPSLTLPKSNVQLHLGTDLVRSAYIPSCMLIVFVFEYLEYIKDKTKFLPRIGRCSLCMIILIIDSFLQHYANILLCRHDDDHAANTTTLQKNCLTAAKPIHENVLLLTSS